MESSEPQKKARKRPQMVAEKRRERFEALSNEEKGADLVEAPPWLLSGLYLVCHDCIVGRWTTNDGSMTRPFGIFRNFHKTHEIEFMGAIRFLTEFLGKDPIGIKKSDGKYIDIDRPKLKPVLVTFGGMAPHALTPVDKPNGPKGALQIQRRLRRQYE